MTHIENVINNTQHDAEFMRFLKELNIREKFFKKVLASEVGKRQEKERVISKSDYILTAFYWHLDHGTDYWKKISHYWNLYIGMEVNEKKKLLQSLKSQL